jgi:tetratricopeptide (TPR) repeat protein
MLILNNLKTSKKMKPFYTIILVCCMTAIGCNKDAFLDKKPSTDIVVPTTLSDLRGMLDYTAVFIWTPGIGELSSDNYYMTATNWQAQNETIRNAYTWEKNITGATRSMLDWTECSKQVLYANIVLEQLAKINPSTADAQEWKDLNGSALFQRAYSWYKLVSIFANGYDSSTAATDLGIPMKFSSDIHTLVQRSTIKETYDKIISDLTIAKTMLSDNVPAVYRNRPSKPAVYALLSRISLSMRRYDATLKYSDSCLALYNKLINYNTVSTTATTPFDKSNDENIFYSSLSNYAILGSISSIAYVDTSLYQSYAANDLRKVIYFRTISGSNMGMKTGYTATTYGNGGLCTDEIYLNRSEAYARAGNVPAAMNDLNNLLSKRWKTGTYVNLTATTDAEALQKIQTERRKELIWRGLRWTDIKRYNREGAGITMKRILNGVSYTIGPNSNLFVLPFPPDEVEQSGIIQNPR